MINRRYLINIAKALKPKCQRSPFHVTFVHRKCKLLSIGINNKNKSHPNNIKYKYQKGHLIGLHSEMSAILKLGIDDCSNLTFHIVRIDNRLKLAFSKPCRGCQHLLRSVGFKKVFYSTKNGFKRWA